MKTVLEVTTSTDGDLLILVAETFTKIFIQDAKQCLNVSLTHEQLIVYNQQHRRHYQAEDDGNYRQTHQVSRRWDKCNPQKY